MPPLPPTKDVLDALQYAVVPAAGAALLVMGIFVLMGRWAGAIGSAAAVVAGFAWANYTYGHHASWDNSPLLPWKPDDPLKPWHWLPRASLVLIVVGLISRWFGQIADRLLRDRAWWCANLIVWAPRIIAVMIVSKWLVSEKWSAQYAWLVPAMTAVSLLSWIAFDGIARGGASAQVATYQSVVFLATGVLLLYHHWASAAFMAVIVGSAMFGVAVIAGATKTDASGAVPAGVGFLPGLLLASRQSQDSHIPLVAFWLIALTPAVLTPFLIPDIVRRIGRLTPVIRAAIFLASVIAAIVLAAQYEQLAFEDEAS